MTVRAPMPKDRVLAASNRIAAEWDKRTRELKKQEMRRKLEARDRGEDEAMTMTTTTTMMTTMR